MEYSSQTKDLKYKQLIASAAKIGRALSQPVIATLFGLLLGAFVILAAGKNPLLVYSDMFSRSFLGSFYFFQTLTRATPIIIAGLATVIAWRAGYINIGVEGQMIIGCFVSTTFVIYVPGPSLLIQIMGIALGMLAGALYACIAAVLNHRFRVSLVICTLMMNYIANNFAAYFANGPMKDNSGDGIAAQTVRIPEATALTRLLPGQTLNTGFVMALLLVVALMWMIKKTRFGYESKMTGLNPLFAEYGGIKRTSVMYRTMALSGALAGLAGITEVFGVSHRYVDNMISSNAYAWTGLMAALIAALHPVGVFFSSIFLAGLQVGGQSLQRTTGIPLQLSTIIQTSITLFVSIKLTKRALRQRKQKQAEQPPSAPVAAANPSDSNPQALAEAADISSKKAED